MAFTVNSSIFFPGLRGTPAFQSDDSILLVAVDYPIIIPDREKVEYRYMHVL